ncbi:hypothetical protein [Pararhizobium sp.]|uniref:hypothetical protein n=1 Tax=Pararhizobium sp. TaxID=1977563 RepID=UPI003D0C76BD
MPDTDRKKWDFDNIGAIKTSRLVEWGVASVTEKVVLRIGYVRSQREHEIYNTDEKAPHQVQVEISASAARALSVQLSRYADWVELELPAGTEINGA